MKNCKYYLDVIKILETSHSNRLSVAIFYKNGRYEWLPVDKTEYLRQLKLISSPETVEYPCWVEVEPDGEMFIHPRVENPFN